MRVVVAVLPTLLLLAACSAAPAGTALPALASAKTTPPPVSPTVAASTTHAPSPALSVTPSIAATSPLPLRSPSASPQSTPRPTPSPPAGNVAATRFESTRYPYAITVPSRITWTDASRVWDGRSRVDVVSPFLDRTSVPDGGLFVFGAPTSAPAEAYAAEIEMQFQRFHACQVLERRTFDIAGSSAFAFAQRCGAGDTFARAVAVHDGFGLVAFVSVSSDPRTALDHLIEWMQTLEWRTT